MDLKVVCPCGAKYQFPVDPVGGRLPCSIACPVCGADNTALGNLILAQKLAALPPPLPVAGAAGQGGIAATPPPPSPLPEAPSLQPMPASPMGVPGPARGAGAGKKIAILSVGVGLLFLVGFGGTLIYQKVRETAREIGDIARAVSDSATSGSNINWTLPSDEGGEMLIKSSDHQAVAKAFGAAYNQIVKQSLTIAPATSAYDDTARFSVYPAHKGAVQVMGSIDWPEPQASALAEAVSKQLGTIVVLALMGDDGDSGVVSIYENGDRRFRLKRWYQITSFSEDGLKEFMERDGESWASKHGYLPSPQKVLTGDTDAMPFEDVNDLVLKLGIDVSDSPDEPKGVLLLK